MMNTAFSTFGEFVIAKRTEKGISLRKLAELMNLSAPYWSDVEKGRKNPPKIDKLEQLAQILTLTDEEKTVMLDLAGKDRNSVAPDIPEYIISNDYVAAALRQVRDLGANEEDWERFVEELKQRKG
jgi:transcriptional regulator with XRE-family HTH domain